MIIAEIYILDGWEAVDVCDALKPVSLKVEAGQPFSRSSISETTK